MKYADLHLHTIASDGTCHPNEVVKDLLKPVFLLYLLQIMIQYQVLMMQFPGRKVRNRSHPGIEFSTLYEQKIEVHILGYYIEWQNNKLKNYR